MIEALQESGVSISSPGGPCYTALHAAVQFASLKVVSWVYKQDLSLLFVDDATGHIPFHVAIYRGDWEIIQELEKLSGHPPSLWERQDRQGRTGLHYAAIATIVTPMVNTLSKPRDNGEIKALGGRRCRRMGPTTLGVPEGYFGDIGYSPGERSQSKGKDE